MSGDSVVGPTRITGSKCMGSKLLVRHIHEQSGTDSHLVHESVPKIEGRIARYAKIW